MGVIAKTSVVKFFLLRLLLLFYWKAGGIENGKWKWNVMYGPCSLNARLSESLHSPHKQGPIAAELCWS